MPATATPDQLIEDARAGDAQALDQLLRHWYPQVMGFARRYFRGRFEAMEAEELSQEVVQRTCVAVHRKLGQLQETARFKSWLFRIATNLCYEEERRKRKRKVLTFSQMSREDEDESPKSPDPAWDDPGADHRLHRRQLADQVQTALAELPDNQRTVLMMKEYQGLTFREIAEALELSENTVKSRLYYALKHLRKNLPMWQRIRDAWYDD